MIWWLQLFQLRTQKTLGGETSNRKLLFLLSLPIFDT